MGWLCTQGGIDRPAGEKNCHPNAWKPDQPGSSLRNYAARTQAPVPNPDLRKCWLVQVSTGLLFKLWHALADLRFPMTMILRLTCLLSVFLQQRLYPGLIGIG